MKPDAVLNLFTQCGALLKGHFQLSSGLHSDQYMQCALLLSEPTRAEALGAALAKLQKQPCDLVVSPAMGGLIIGHEVGRALGARAYFSERENGIMSLRRGFALKPGEKIVVVEDVITTGKSSAEVISLIKNLGAEVVGALSIVNRGAQAAPLGVPTASLLNLPIASYLPADCPLCRQGAPMVKPGSRKELP